MAADLLGIWGIWGLTRHVQLVIFLLGAQTCWMGARDYQGVIMTTYDVGLLSPTAHFLLLVCFICFFCTLRLLHFLPLQLLQFLLLRILPRVLHCRPPTATASAATTNRYHRHSCSNTPNTPTLNPKSWTLNLKSYIAIPINPKS